MLLQKLILLQTLFSDATPPDSVAAAAGNVGGLAELKALSTQDLLSRLANSAVSFAINLAIAIVVFYVGRFIIKKIYDFVRSIFVTRRIDPSLATFVLSLINIVLYFILIVTVIGILGIETTSFLALFASAGVAIGMALSGTLQNFAGGVLILLLKPYKIGDFIEVQGYSGTVREIQIFFTVITTGDNKSILIPNGGLSTGSVNNYSREAYRRVQWTVSISYGDDVNAARDAIFKLFEEDKRVMPLTNEDNPEMQIVDGNGKEEPETADDTSVDAVKDEPAPAPARRPGWIRSIFGKKITEAEDVLLSLKKNDKGGQLVAPPNYSPAVLVNELGASSVDLQVRAWVKSADYWNVYFYYNELFYNELPKYGIHFPFPQLDVHVSSTNA